MLTPDTYDQYDGPETPEASEAFDGLVFSALSRYVETVGRREATPGVVWLSSERMRFEDQPDEYAMWYRLGASTELLPGIENFDVGIVVKDPDVVTPEPAVQTEADKHFYIRRWTETERKTGIVAVKNAIEVVETPRATTEIPVRGLATKLDTYKLHNIRMWSARGDIPKDIVA